jgi:hypothetical protein
MNKAEQMSKELGISRARVLNGKDYPVLGVDPEGCRVIINADMLYMKQLRLPMCKKVYWEGYTNEVSILRENAKVNKKS